MLNIYVIILLFLLPKILLSIYVYRDAINKNIGYPLLWSFGTFFIPYFFGFIVYLIISRYNFSLRCPYCGNHTEKNRAYCSCCGKKLSDNIDTEYKYKNNNKFIKVVLILTIIYFIIPFVYFGPIHMMINPRYNINQIITELKHKESIDYQNISSSELKFKNDNDKYIFDRDLIIDQSPVKISGKIKSGNVTINAYIKGENVYSENFDNDKQMLVINIDRFETLFDDDDVEKNIHFVFKTENATGKLKTNI